MRIGSGLADSTLQYMKRVEAMQSSVQWLQARGDRLVDVIGQEMSRGSEA